MAVGSKLVMEFESNQGNKKYTLNYANPNVQTSQVKALMNAYISATALFDVTLSGLVGAYLETTTRDEFTLDD